MINVFAVAIIVLWIIILFREKYIIDNWILIDESQQNISNVLDGVAVVQDESSQTWSQTWSEVTDQLAGLRVQDVFEIQQEHNQMSLETIRGLVQDKSSLYAYDYENLKAIYQKNPRKDVLAVLVTAALQQFAYGEAYDFLRILWQEAIAYIPSQTIAEVLLNSPLISYRDEVNTNYVVTSIRNLYAEWYISIDDWSMYQWILSFLRLDMQDMQMQFAKITDPWKYPLVAAVDQAYASRSQQVDVPTYYLHALVALQFMQHWYFKIAQQIAVQVLLSNAAYILPYQILAYSHFVMHDRDIAVEYFQSLMQIDKSNEQKYNFLLGIAYFWLEKYPNAIIALKQSNIPEFQLDIYRYLLLAYEKISDEQNILATFQQLLGQSNIWFYDFYLYFETALFQPYRDNRSYTLYTANQILARQYLQFCFEKLSIEEQYVCQYGQAGVLLADNRSQEAGSILLQVSQNMEKSYIYHALWDWYMRNQQLENAKDAYIRALSLSATDIQKDKSKDKLFTVMELLR